jgi:HEPN domain-containing protein
LARRRRITSPRSIWPGVGQDRSGAGSVFHAQQCAEKYLKARIEEAGLTVPRTHDLDVILNQILPVEPLWSAFRPALQTLTDYAVDFRYPGHSTHKSHARRALTDCKSVRREVRTSLGLPV